MIMTLPNLDELLGGPSGTAAGERGAGEDLSGSKEFQALQKTATAGGDWAAKVAEDAASLLRRSKDLRVAYWLCLAWTRASGFPGLAAGLSALQRLVKDYWGHGLHPKDIDARVLALNRLAARHTLHEPVRLIGLVVSSAPLKGAVDSKEAITWDEWNQAPVQKPTTDAERTEHQQLLDRIKEGPDPEIAESVRSACQSLKELSQHVPKHIESTEEAEAELSLKPLEDLLEAIKALVEPAAPPKQAGSQTPSGAGGRQGAPVTVGGRVNCSADVVALLEALNLYYRGHEPSSPVPFLLEQARRLVGKDFLSVAKELLIEEDFHKLAGLFPGARDSAPNPGSAAEPLAEAPAAALGIEASSIPAAVKEFGDAVNTPDDVKAALRETCAYYARCEPSSPVLQVLQQALRWTKMDYRMLTKECVPGAKWRAGAFIEEAPNPGAGNTPKQP
jgi:type VI secretion system protein ImpA